MMDSRSAQGSWSRREFLRRSTLAGLGIAFGGSALAACGGEQEEPDATAPGETPENGDLQSVSFLLDITPYGKHAMFFAPLVLGYWSDRGLDVRIDAAQGSGDNVSKMGAKVADFGFADTMSLIIGRAAGAEIKEICMHHYLNLMCVIGREDNPITEPSHLEGLAIGGTSGDAPRVLLPALARINDLDLDAIELITMEHLAKPAALMERRIDGAFEFFTSYPAFEIAAEERGEGLTHFLYADYGLDLYSSGLIAHDDMLEENPDLVRRFVEGFVEGVKWVVENPDDATDIMIDEQPGLSFDVARAQLQVAIDHLLVDEVMENGIGPMGEEKMSFTVEVANEYFDLDREVSLDEVYTNEFVPTGVIPDV